MEIKWLDDYRIRITVDNHSTTISANREGLLSLAEQLTALAGESRGSHIHYDENNSLEEGSDELIIERI